MSFAVLQRTMGGSLPRADGATTVQNGRPFSSG
jgi:hypothetical protein